MSDDKIKIDLGYHKPYISPAKFETHKPKGKNYDWVFFVTLYVMWVLSIVGNKLIG